ncbi:MAG: hypothetical protein ACE5GI_01130 [Candidatus Aminicenantales bacterium]
MEARSDHKQRSHYFQTIARYFFALRGAPFWLSSKELDLISEWEKAGIPLQVVLEGLNRAFAKTRTRAKARFYPRSLLYCDFEVKASFEQFKERQIGGSQAKPPQESKKNRAKQAIESFIENMPSSLIYLREAYAQVRRILSQKEISEEKLEFLEDKIEKLLLEQATPEEMARVRGIVRKEYDVKNDQQFDLMWKIKLVKYLREKYKVPYVSLYYY